MQMAYVDTLLHRRLNLYEIQKVKNKKNYKTKKIKVKKENQKKRHIS